MLCLGNRHSVTGNNHYAANAVQKHGDLVTTCLFDFSSVNIVGTGPTGRGTHRTEEHVGEGTVHGLTHDGGQDDTGGTNK